MLVKQYERNAVVLIPQNKEWTKTSEMVKEIATVSGKKIRFIMTMKPFVYLREKCMERLSDNFPYSLFHKS